MDDDVTDWRELREFQGTDLAASFLLSAQLADGSLQLEIDLCLQPEHPFYEAPRPSESACLRPAVLEFPACSGLDVGESSARGEAVAAAAERLGHGPITGLQRVGEGVYRLDGAFGTATIFAGRPLLRLSGPSG